MRLSTVVTTVFFCWVMLFGANIHAGEQAPKQKSTERMVTERLYVYDPTIAEVGWVIGVGIEGWYVIDKREVVDAGGNRIGDSDKEGFLGGGTFYVGKGDFTFFVMGRKGSFIYDYISNTGGTSVGHETEVDRSELELKGRWLLPKLSASLSSKLSMVPYVLAGVNYLTEDNRNHIKTPGYGFASTLSPDQDSEREYLSPLLGLGVIVPISDSVGIRVDLVGNYSFAEKEWERREQPWGKVTGEDWGYAAHATLYWAITKHFNMQIGIKNQKLDGGDDVGRTYFLGAYTMLGWTF